MRQIIGNVKEALLPYLMWHFRMIKAGLITTVESPEKECGELPLNTDDKNPCNFEASAEEEHLTSETTNTNGIADQRESSEERTVRNNLGNEEEKPFIGDLSENKDCMELPPRKPSAVNSPSQAEVESTMSEVRIKYTFLITTTVSTCTTNHLYYHHLLCSALRG